MLFVFPQFAWFLIILLLGKYCYNYNYGNLLELYVEIAKHNFIKACKDSELLIRLLVIPTHIECDAKPILKWIKDNLGAEVRVNIMRQYHPVWMTNRFPEINRALATKEYEGVVAYAVKIGFKNFVTQ